MAPAEAFGSTNAAESTFTTPGQVLAITPNFEVDPMVAAGGYHALGLQSDGSVIATGLNITGQCSIDDWENSIQVAAGGYHTVGLRTDGTIVAAGVNDYGQCNVGNWTDIVQVSAGYRHTVGLKTNGTVIAVGRDSDDQCDVDQWNLGWVLSATKR
jgi:alpha-tubulin suppressor-like RCC1 family protein